MLDTEKLEAALQLELARTSRVIEAGFRNYRQTMEKMAERLCSAVSDMYARAGKPYGDSEEDMKRWFWAMMGYREIGPNRKAGEEEKEAKRA